MVKYSLTSKESDALEMAWKFLDVFNRNYIFVTQYRMHLIEILSKRYTPEQFLLYEGIINKLFWNLRHEVAKLWVHKPESREQFDQLLYFDELPTSLTQCYVRPYRENGELEQLLQQNSIVLNTYGSHYRSFINKLLIVDPVAQQVWFKPMEGSAEIFSKNHFNLYTMSLLFHRTLYDEFMKDPYGCRDMELTLPEYYFEFDYGFPNLNCCQFAIGREKDRMRRIQKMYYCTSPKKDTNWHRIIF